jgi:Flp pilus assembly protein TadG
MIALRKIMPPMRLLYCDRGATAVEFALVAPAFIMLMVGVLTGSLLLYTASSLHYAAEGAARCYSVNSASCSTSSATQTYALSHYYGPASPQPSFTASTPACGHQVVGTVTYILGGGTKTWSVPLSATACFP